MPITLRSTALSGLFAIGASSLAAIGGAPPAQAQVTKAVPAPQADTSGTVTHLVGPGLPSVNANQTLRDADGHEFFRVLGFSGQVTAPVASPYDAHNTYETFGGQPGRGSTAVLKAGMDGSP